MKKLILFLASFYPLLVFSSELPDTIDKVRGSIVSVGIFRPEKTLHPKGPGHEYRATGFVVRDGRKIVTNFHVLPKNMENDPNAVLAVFVNAGKNTQVRPAKVIKHDKQHDLAILEIYGAPLPKMILNTQKKVREGDDIAFTGFPIGLVLGLHPVTTKGIVSAITPMVIPSQSSRTLTAAQIRGLRSPFNIYQLDAIAYPGNSGSPVYDPSSGEVIGVINSVFVKATKEALLKEPSAIAYAIPIAYVEALLDE